MKFNELWLRDWVAPELSTEALAAQLTMAGLEVDAVTPVAGIFSGVVVGEIVAIAPHPDADKLRICQVAEGGDQAVQVVCGATNARAGLKVPFAKLGAILPGDFNIKQAKLRGVESFGMLCAAAELGLAEQSNGLLELPADAPVGADIRSYLNLDDCVIEVGLTPNRADCLSVAGLAREVGVLSGSIVRPVEITSVNPAIDEVFPIEIIAGEDCPRYVGRVIRNVDLTRPAPEWLRERLRRCGIRSIDPVVDVTNYVMLELGQPMHAFDLDRLEGGIRVRKAEPGEELATLDGQQLTLRTDSLVIADHRGPLALAGVMGGRPSAVSATTRHIFLESAFFAPGLIAGKARSYGLHTESSHRFERGVDYQLQTKAIERATRLILDCVGGAAGPISEVALPSLPSPVAIHLRRSRIVRLLGVEIADARIEQILAGLGMTVTSLANGWSVVAPSWRFDISIEVDLIEELARVHGYDHLPVRSIRADLPLVAKPEAQLNLTALRRILTARGYQEAITYSFVDPKMQTLLAPQQAVVELLNPISGELSVMRTTLWAGLLSTLSYNLNRQQQRIRLFETGLRFLPAATGLPQQEKMLAIIATGRRHPESWSTVAEPVDFYDLKGDLESILTLARISAEITYAPGSHAALHPGQSATILRNGKVCGHIGALHPELQRQLDIDQPVYLLEIVFADILQGTLPKFSELSKYPEVRRDLALIVDRDTPADMVLATVCEAAGSYLRNLTLFDVYLGKGIDPQRKSLALGLTFQHSSRTLNEEEVNVIVEVVVEALKTRLAATLRT